MKSIIFGTTTILRARNLYDSPFNNIYSVSRSTKHCTRLTCFLARHLLIFSYFESFSFNMKSSKLQGREHFYVFKCRLCHYIHKSKKSFGLKLVDIGLKRKAQFNVDFKYCYLIQVVVFSHKTMKSYNFRNITLLLYTLLENYRDKQNKILVTSIFS